MIFVPFSVMKNYLKIYLHKKYPYKTFSVTEQFVITVPSIFCVHFTAAHPGITILLLQTNMAPYEI